MSLDKSPYELIESFDETLWRQGLEALSVEHTTSAIEALVGLLSDKTWRKRESAAKALIEWGPEVVPVIIQRLNPQNTDEFYWLLHILGHFNDPAGRQKVKAFLVHPESEIRSFAVRSLSICSSTSNANLLFPMLNDPNWSVRKLVFERLLSFGKLILDDLRAIIKDSKEEPNHPVVALLIKIGGESAMPEIIELFRNGSFTMRYSIISALGEEEFSDAIDFLISGLSDESWVIRKRAAELLTKMGSKIFDRLSGWFPRGDSLMKHQIVAIIVDLLGERALPLIRRLLSSPDNEYRILAIESLSRLPGDEPARLMIKCLSDHHRIVSDYASDCLAKKNNLNLELLLEHLSTDDENLRFLVIKTIGNIGGLALNPIIRILEEGNKLERLFLLSVLQRIDATPKLIDALINLLSDNSWPVRNSAANCLKAYGEHAVSAIVRVLNAPSEDVQYWSKRILLSMGPSAVTALTKILDEGTDGSLIPHIISALLAMNDANAVPAVLRFLEKNDDNRIRSVLNGITEIISREIIDTILNLINHPDDRIVKWLSFLLQKVKKSQLRRVVLLGLNHPEERSRFYVLDAVCCWENLAENELRMILRQLDVEKNPKNIMSVFRILTGYPVQMVLTTIKDYLKTSDPDFMLDAMLLIAQAERPHFGVLLAELLKSRSGVIQIRDVEKVGRILGLIYKSKPEGIMQDLSSHDMAYRLCCVVALEEIHDRRVAFALMDRLNPKDDPTIIKRAVKILAKYFFSEDFRLKGAVTDYLLELGTVIAEPLCEVISDIENEIDRKAVIDLIESVGGTIDQTALKRKGEPRVIISDSLLDDVLDKRKKAMEDLQKYDKMIQTSHTQELTIMFTDVKGYTAFSSKASLSEVMSMLKQHDDILIPIFEKHLGKVLKKIGDAFLVVFEQPAKAVLAGIEIQRKLKEYNLEAPDDSKLAVRIAVNTGSVVRRENDVFGDAVNVASRLEGIGDAGEIIISESTYLKVDQSVFDFVSFGEHQLKGLEKRIKTYKCRW